MLRLNAIVIKTSNLKQRHSFANDTTTERSFHKTAYACMCWRVGVSGIIFLNRHSTEERRKNVCWSCYLRWMYGNIVDYTLGIIIVVGENGLLKITCRDVRFCFMFVARELGTQSSIFAIFISLSSRHMHTHMHM